MARQTINGPQNARFDFNTSDSTEYGDSAVSAVSKINANFSELYATAGGLTTFGSETDGTRVVSQSN
jgi:hypothetical protein